jgi:MarR family transcriptional regulator, organic hydroperoxide resistance regulator
VVEPESGAQPGAERDALSAWPTGRLLATAARTVENRWHRALDELGLTHAGLVALHLIGDSTLSQAELARAAHVEAQTMSRTVERLERSGYVDRTPDAGDRRRLVLRRTRDGEEALARAERVERELFPEIAAPAAFREALLAIIRDGD